MPDGEPKPKSKTIIRTVRQYSKPLPEETMEFLRGIAADYAKVKAIVYQRYSGIGSLNKIYPGYTVLSELNATPLRQELNLPYRYYALAISDALSGIKSEWGRLKKKIISLVRKNGNLTDDERHYIFAVLKYDVMYSAVLNRQSFTRPAFAEDAGLNMKKLDNLICRLTRKHKNKPGTNIGGGYFTADKDAYSYKNGGIAFASRTPYRRVFIPLTDNAAYTKQMIVRLNETNVELNVPVESRVKTHKDYTNKLSLHLGYTVMLTTSTGNEYGDRLGEYLSDRTQRIDAKQSARNIYYVVMRKSAEAGKVGIAKKIELNNLGSKKLASQGARELRRIKNYINEEINRMLRTEKPKELVIPSTNKQFGQTMSKRSKHKLSYWMIGFVRQRLYFKCAEHNVHIKEVSPAYTGTVCAKCGAAGRRMNHIFVCTACNTRETYSLNAAHNLSKKADGTFYVPVKRELSDGS